MLTRFMPTRLLAIYTILRGNSVIYRVDVHGPAKVGLSMGSLVADSTFRSGPFTIVPRR